MRLSSRTKRSLSTIRQLPSKIRRELSLDPDKERRTAGAYLERPKTANTTSTSSSSGRFSSVFERLKKGD